jgi:hypothetical protein
MVVFALLRRVALNMLALYRSVTQRGEDQRLTPWKDLMNALRTTLLVATDATVRGLRQREAAATEA